MIKVLICDGDGTLQLPNPSDEVRHLVGALPELGIRLAVASNAPNSRLIEQQFRKANLPIPDIIVTKGDVSVSKPSPEYVLEICRQAGVDIHEVVYLGDDDKTDTFCAINARVLPFSAKYSNSGKPMEYGLPVESPEALLDYLSTYGRQEAPYFGWIYQGTCTDTKSEIDVYALIGNHGRMGLTPLLKEFLKDKKDVVVGRRQNLLGSVLFHYLVSQTYLSGLISNIDHVAVYPGHSAGSQNIILEQYSFLLKSAFRQRYIPDILVRHTDARASHLVAGNVRDIYEQFRTILVNPNYANRLEGKRVLVLDDFTTSGSSLETARRMLLKAGANKVYSLAIAKYRNEYSRTVIHHDWNPFTPCTLRREDITVVQEAGRLNPDADDFFQHHIWPVYGG